MPGGDERDNALGDLSTEVCEGGELCLWRMTSDGLTNLPHSNLTRTEEVAGAKYDPPVHTLCTHSTQRKNKWLHPQPSILTNNAIPLLLLLSSLEHSFILADSLRQWP
jgi:hypothetical protein